MLHTRTSAPQGKRCARLINGKKMCVCVCVLVLILFFWAHCWDFGLSRSSCGITSPFLMKRPLYLGLLSAFILRRRYLTFLLNLLLRFFSLYLSRQARLLRVNSSTSSDSEDVVDAACSTDLLSTRTGAMAAAGACCWCAGGPNTRWDSSQESKTLPKSRSRSKGLVQSALSKKSKSGTARAGGASWNSAEALCCL